MAQPALKLHTKKVAWSNEDEELPPLDLSDFRAGRATLLCRQDDKDQAGDLYLLDANTEDLAPQQVAAAQYAEGAVSEGHHVVWLEHGQGDPSGRYVPVGWLVALDLMTGQTQQLTPAGRFSRPQMNGGMVTWVEHGDGWPSIHRERSVAIWTANLATGSTMRYDSPFSFPLSAAWPAGGAVVVQSGPGADDSQSGCYWWKPGTWRWDQLTSSSSLGAVDSPHMIWYESTSGRNVAMLLDLVSREKRPVSTTPGNKHAAQVKGGLAVWMDRPPGDSPTFFLGNLQTGKEQLLEVSWSHYDGRFRFDGRHILHYDQNSDLAISTLP